MKTRTPKKRATGHRDLPDGDPKIALRLSPEMFDRLADEAFQRGLPMSSLIRAYLYTGMYGSVNKRKELMDG